MSTRRRSSGPVSIDVTFDSASCQIMGEVFDVVCKSLGVDDEAIVTRAAIAIRIINAAKNGEFDFDRLCDAATRVGP
jgi:hypothetical protein